MPASGVRWLMLGSGCAFRCGFLAIALVEAVHASGGIDQLLLAGKERVASGTNFDVQVTFLGGASLERLAARAGDGDINVFWVNSWFHMLTLSRQPPGRDFKRDIVAETSCFTQRHKGKTPTHKDRVHRLRAFVYSLCAFV